MFNTHAKFERMIFDWACKHVIEDFQSYRGPNTGRCQHKAPTVYRYACGFKFGERHKQIMLLWINLKKQRSEVITTLSSAFLSTSEFKSVKIISSSLVILLNGITKKILRGQKRRNHEKVSISSRAK